MILLAWNVRGLGRAERVRALKNDVRHLKPDILFLSETLSSSSRLSHILEPLGFTNLCFVPPSGIKKPAGGLCLAWKMGVDIEITLQNQNIINALVFSDPPTTPWMLSMVYGPPHWTNKRQFWDDMDTTAKAFNGPWLCMGDFNAVVDQTEKKGRLPVASSSDGGLGGFINSHHLIDLGFSGNPFTWNNNRPLAANIQERLDKAYSNSEWRALFQDATITHIPGKSSDHLPIVLHTHSSKPPSLKPFKFEAAWTRDLSSHQVVKSAWRKQFFGTPEFVLCRRTDNVSQALRRWNITHFGHIQTQIKKLSEYLDTVQQQEPTVRNIELQRNIQNQIDEQCCREEWLWHQKSRLQWIKDGDRNTKFFHLSTIIRRRQNSIDFIKDKHGNWISSREEIGTCFTEHFSELYKSSNPSFPDDLEGLLPRVLTADDLLRLQEIPSITEISSTLMKFSNLKAPGPNGMPSLFYKTYWESGLESVERYLVVYAF
ncbi:hypothetical protein RJ639_008317 [Escallonia herrerae]|uniref:Endonuclease/exonuclease/phosphatase domain-containing protein n=1 Tax=Escallonia herrerae TaxID=1293975 RepID=A0AA88VUZ2_9ASTE|nr:hypothetical protein RJ639_008317 [Escallonia herrerae]